MTNDSPIRHCRWCGTAYDWRRSTSALRFQFCEVSHEIRALGFSIDALIASRLERRSSEVLLSL